MSNQSKEAMQQAKKVVQAETSEDAAYDPTACPIWELAAEIGAQVPNEEWAKVPSDLSKNLDHYLYGAPRDDG